jgi:anaerobic selenocysteine-containing dehydrogenase
MPTAIPAALSDEQIAHRICPLCEACCGLEVRHRNGQVVSIRGHEQDVFSRGYICPKGASLKDLHEDPDRLRTPLIKRDGQFVQATWDEAFAEIERRLPRIKAAQGNDAIGIAIGNPSAHKIGLMLNFPRLLKALGTGNFFSASTLDQMPKQLQAGLMFGNWLTIPVPDIERTDFMLLIGGNPMVSNGSMWTVPDFRGKAKALRERGGKLVVIDPRRSETAAVANAHHFIRPGADVYLLLAMVHTLFDENLVKLGSAAPHLQGLAEVKAATAAYSAEAMAPRCGIESVTLRELARELAQAKRAVVYGRIGTCTQSFGTLNSWLIELLNVLTGNLDQPGGAMFAKSATFAANTAGPSGVGKGVSTGRRKSRVSGAPEVMGELPMNCLAEEIETPGVGQIKAMITIAANPVLSAPNGVRISRALESLDFMLSLDIYVNETTRHADVILPGLSPLEEMHFDVPFPQFGYRNAVRVSQPVFIPDADHPHEWKTMLRLVGLLQGKGANVDVLASDAELFEGEVRKTLGEDAEQAIAATRHLRGPARFVELSLRTGPYGDKFGRDAEGLTLTKVSDTPGGIDLGALKPRLPEVLRTPSGKVELAPPQLLQDLKRVDIELAKPQVADGPTSMQIIGRRQVRSGNSWMHNLPVLAKGPFRCTALVHPEDAQRLGLTDGGLAQFSAQGQIIQAQIQISDEVMSGVVSLPHGWGHDLPGARQQLAAQRPGANLNALLSDRVWDPLSGNAVLSGGAITVTALNGSN